MILRLGGTRIMVEATLRNKAKENFKYKTILSEVEKAVESVKHHLNQITTQMINYDIHDKSHSEEVLDIIGQLLGDRCETLSFYELLLIYLSAYMHDSAMALPQWEYLLLQAIEGTNECKDNTLDFTICNDFRPIHMFAEAKQIITKNKDKLYGEFDTVSKFIFADENEAMLIEGLAELMCSYEQFRNRYARELKKSMNTVAEFIKYSKLLRMEFIRSTHHLRVEKNIHNLKKVLAPVLGNVDAESLLEQLTVICRSHCENVSYLTSKTCKYQMLDKQENNVCFIAQLLRLGDVIHFNSLRAPMSLYAEKRITDEISMMHWKAKFNELNYKIERKDGKVFISFSAYCRTPEEYYFIQDYMDWIDCEITNYYLLKNVWDKSNISNVEKYNLCIERNVDRTNILADKQKFVPDRNMKFVLEQSQILNLLTGIQLYKDKYLCLREIYQNAYDATKCMIAENNKRGIHTNYSIIFGIGEDILNGRSRKYIYCLDQGIGMDEYVIRNYLLNIGKSYYKSKDFAEKNVEWRNEVKPISQFGIGLLSGYMIADCIGVVTKSYVEDSKVISFMLEGVNEHFYYVNASREDTELLGEHGTIIKLYLKDCEQTIYNYKLKKYPLMLLTQDMNKFDKWDLGENCRYHLLYLVSKNIGIEMNDIEVYVRDDADDLNRIISRTTIFDYREYKDITQKDLELLWEDYHYMDGSKGVHFDAIAMREYMIDYRIVVRTSNIELFTVITLPTEVKDIWNNKILNYYGFMNARNCAVFVDGIPVESNISFDSEFREIIGRNSQGKCIINYYGEKRPVLSVDRSNIVDGLDFKEEIQTLKDELCDKLAEIVVMHISEVGATEKAELSNLILGIVLQEYPQLYNSVLKLLSQKENINLLFPDKVSERETSLRDIFEQRDIRVENIDFRKYKEFTRQIMINKMLCATKVTICQGNLVVENAIYTEPPRLKHSFSEEDNSMKFVAIRADIFDDEYSEYDLVSKYWPVVSPQLYDSLIDEYENIELHEKRTKLVSAYSNSISAIALIDPFYVDSKIGIMQPERDRFRKEILPDCVERIMNGFWLYELTNHGKIMQEEKSGRALFAFISPRDLSEGEMIFHEEFKRNNVERYKGISEGWSILFLGAIEKYIIVPGKIKVSEIIKLIPESYKKMDRWVEHYLPNGTKIE